MVIPGIDFSKPRLSFHIFNFIPIPDHGHVQGREGEAKQACIG
jgi:hypothetical protein